MGVTVWLCVLICFIFPSVVLSVETIGGLPLDTKYLEIRRILDDRTTINGTTYISSFTNINGSFDISIRCNSTNLRHLEDSGEYNLTCSLSYTSNQDISMNFYSDYPISVDLVQPFVFNIPKSPNLRTQNITLPLIMAQLGDAYIVARSNSTVTVGVRLLVLRKSGVVDVIFRAGLIILLVLATFFMGCEIDFDSIRVYAKKPFGPILGFICQFVIMPSVSFVSNINNPNPYFDRPLIFYILSFC